MRPIVLAAVLTTIVVIACGCERVSGGHEGHHHDHKPASDDQAHAEAEDKVAKAVPAAKDGHAAHGDPHAGETKHTEATSEVHLTEVAVDQNGIKTEPATYGTVGVGIAVPAQIVPIPTRVVHVTLPVPGRVTSVKAAIGDRVQKGAVLATIESAEVGEAQSAIAAAGADVEVATKEVARQQELVASGIGARKNLEEAEAALKRAQAAAAGASQKARVYGGAESRGSTITLRAPIAGQIIEHHGNVGEVVDPEEPVFVVADLSTVWVEGRVYEQDLAKADVGAKAMLTLQAFPGRAWDSTVSYVAPVVDEKTRSVPIRIELPNQDGKLKPGLFGTLSVVTSGDGGASPSNIVVPESAVQRMERGDVVFVAAGHKGEFHAVPVATGARKDGRVEVLSGLKPGDPVVVAGAFILKSELMKGQLGEGHAH